MISTFAGIISLCSQKNEHYWNNSNKRTGGKKENHFMFCVEGFYALYINFHSFIHYVYMY